MTDVKVKEIVFSNDAPFVLIAGPCQMESASHGMEMALALKELTTKMAIPFVLDYCCGWSSMLPNDN